MVNLNKFTIFKQCGIISMNKPKQLNTLDTHFLTTVRQQLQHWNDIKLKLILIESAARGLFSAGGDMKAVLPASTTPEKYNYSIYDVGYCVPYLIEQSRIPVISLIDGFAIGGGFQLCIGGKYRIVSENASICYPEAAIGSFPDGTACYYLSRLKNKIGTMMALTGYQLKAADAVKCGLATHHVLSRNFPYLKEDLLNTHDLSRIDNYSKTVKYGELDALLPKIERCFAGDSVQHIINNLKDDGSPLALSLIARMSRLSPTSLKVTHKLLKYSETAELSDCVKMELNLIRKLTALHDFNEGVTVQLVNKSAAPKWQPSKLSEVDDNLINDLFN